ncbi:hypothetical protein GZ77_14990 [Endozoicomonas montiporae]|uniref:Uncharacterized protein n=2 Tax=Endozoicomonas montiporae TaxID=1027273 RepID=A0A081N595_9GAMM|nr:hypothetical protein GZ77_14990 [Endozoicomonas montiporae]
MPRPAPASNSSQGGDSGISSRNSSDSFISNFSSFNSLGSVDDDLPPPPDSFQPDTQPSDTTEKVEAQPTERKDTRSKKQKVGDELHSAGRKLKSETYGRAKRFLTGKNWKKISPERLKGFPEQLHAKVQERNTKLDRLDSLKASKLEWQQFEREFGSEVDLLKAGSPPKKGTFKIPDTGQKFTFSKTQSMRQRDQMLSEFKKAFENSGGYENYQNASDETTGIDAQRADLKDQISKLNKEMKAELDSHYAGSEGRQHAYIDQMTQNRHRKLDSDKSAKRVEHHKTVELLQNQVENAQTELSHLRARRDRFKEVEIPKKERQIKALEKQLKRQKGDKTELKQQLAKAKDEKRSMQFTVDDYFSDRAELRNKLNASKEQLKKATKKDKKDVLSTTLKKLDKSSLEEDKKAEKEHDYATKATRRERRGLKSDLKGRKL